MSCPDYIRGRCTICGGPLYAGMVWHGRKHTWLEWLEAYGATCPHCQAHKEKEARKDTPLKGSKTRRRK